MVGALCMAGYLSGNHALCRWTVTEGTPPMALNSSMCFFALALAGFLRETNGYGMPFRKAND